MKKLLLKINDFFEGIPEWSLKNKPWLIAGFCVFTVLGFLGIGKVKIISSMEAVFQSDDEVKIAYDRFRAEFGGDEVLYIVYRAKDGDIFSQNSLEAVEGIQEELSAFFQGKDNYNPELEHITDITTIINASYLEGSEGILLSRGFVGNTSNLTESERKNLRETARKHPDYSRLLVSEDCEYGGIILRTDFNAQVVASNRTGSVSGTGPEPGTETGTGTGTGGATPEGGESFIFSPDVTTGPENPAGPAGPAGIEQPPEFRISTMQEYVPFTDAVREITDKPEYTEHLDFYYAGNPELMSFLARVLPPEMGMIFLGSLLLIMITLAFLFRSGSGVLWPVLIVISTLIWTLGTVGWSNVASTDTVMIIVFLLVAVGVADAIHILSGYIYFRRKGEDRRQAIRSVYGKSGFSCFLTSITTVVGLLAMTVVKVSAMQVFGIFAAVGVFYAFVITIVMLPILLNIWAPMSGRTLARLERKNTKNISFIQKGLQGIITLTARKTFPIIVIFVVSGGILLCGFFFIEVDSNLVTIIKEDRPIRGVYDLVDRTMAGTGNVEILVDSGVADGHKAPIVLKAIDDLQVRLESDYPEIVRKTISLANIVKDSNRAINEGRQEYYRIPDDPDTLAQTLILFDGANPKDRRLFVSDDYRTSRITLNIVNLGSKEAIAFMEKVERAADETFVECHAAFPGLKVNYTGQIPLFMQMMNYMSWSQISSFAVTLTIISIILLLVFGSFKTGFISILPNIFPIVTVAGVMGFCKVPLDLHTLLVLPIIIGIAVDDTIHFITYFRFEYSKTGDARLAVRRAVSEVGQAIVFTSVILAVGYLVFLMATNRGFGYFGILSSIAITTATIADLVFLPSLLLVFYGGKKKPAGKAARDNLELMEEAVK